MLKTVGEKSIMNIKKFLSKNYNVIALCLFVLCNVCGVIGFYLIDEETAFRPELWQDNWYSELIKVCCNLPLQSYSAARRLRLPRRRA